tara:strand:- start:1 stop:186 length:186 start_codon:yes stop_codon:yes gene_type:complete
MPRPQCQRIYRLFTIRATANDLPGMQNGTSPTPIALLWLVGFAGIAVFERKKPALFPVRAF